MTQNNRTFIVECLNTSKVLGVFNSQEEAVNYCQEHKLIVVAIPHAFQFTKPLPLPDSPTNLVMYAYPQKERN